MTCEDCKGSGISSLFSGRCFSCKGTGRDPWEMKLQTHEGICELAGRVAYGELDLLVKLKILRATDPSLSQPIKAVEVISKNPCLYCGTYNLQEEWVGSAFCSKKCTTTMASESGPRQKYAKDMLDYHHKRQTNET